MSRTKKMRQTSNKRKANIAGAIVTVPAKTDLDTIIIERVEKALAEDEDTSVTPRQIITEVAEDPGVSRNEAFSSVYHLINSGSLELDQDYNLRTHGS